MFGEISAKAIHETGQGIFWFAHVPALKLVLHWDLVGVRVCVEAIFDWILFEVNFFVVVLLYQGIETIYTLWIIHIDINWNRINSIITIYTCWINGWNISVLQTLFATRNSGVVPGVEVHRQLSVALVVLDWFWTIFGLGCAKPFNTFGLVNGALSATSRRLANRSIRVLVIPGFLRLLSLCLCFLLGQVMLLHIIGLNRSR